MTIWQSNILMKMGAEKIPIYRAKLLGNSFKKEKSHYSGIQ